MKERLLGFVVAGVFDVDVVVFLAVVVAASAAAAAASWSSGRERRACDRDIRVSCEMGLSIVVGSLDSSSSSSEREEELLHRLRRWLSTGKREMADRICGVVVSRTIALFTLLIWRRAP